MTQQIDRTTTAPAPAGRPPSSGPRVHRGWALMVVAGLVAAVANLAALGGSTDGVEVLAVAADTPPGTPVGQLATTVVSLAVDDPDAVHLVTPARLGAELSGTVTTTRLATGDLLRAGDLRPATDHSRAAMSVPIDASRAVAGGIAAGDVVDVLAEVDDVVVVIVGDAEVLDVATGGEGFASGSSLAIVLSVDEDDAIALSTAMRDSELDIVRTAGGVGG